MLVHVNLLNHGGVEFMIVHVKVNFVKSIALSYMCPLIRNVWLRNIFHDLGVKVVAVTKKYALK